MTKGNTALQMEEAIDFNRTYSMEEYYEAMDKRSGLYPVIELMHGRLIVMENPTVNHQRMLTELCYLIKDHIKKKGGKCEVFAGPIAVEFSKDIKKENGFKEDSVVCPDVMVVCEKDRLTKRGCKGAPDWVIEISSPSNASYDYSSKANLYTSGGVREYWIVDIIKNRIMVFRMREDIPEDADKAGYYDVEIYGIKDKVRAGIYDDLEIDFSTIEF